MRKNKILAILTAFIMLMSIIPTNLVYADSISTEAKACKDLGGTYRR